MVKIGCTTLFINYLKDSERKVKRYIQRARYEEWEFAAKVVRGAYMVLERDRAKEMGYESPIHNTIATHENYDNIVRYIMNRESVQKNESNVNIVVASHNQNSIENTIKEMKRCGISKRTKCLFWPAARHGRSFDIYA